MFDAVVGAFGGAIDNALGTDFTGGKAIGRARDAQGLARDQANAASEQAWTRQQAEMEPWKAAGLKALAGLQDGSFYQQDPGYQFRLDEGNKAINAAMSARGNAGGGAALKELARYGQNFASNEYQNAWNRTNALANYGNQASMALGNFAGGHSANLSNNAIGFGNAAAGAELGKYQNQVSAGKSAMETGGQAAGMLMQIFSDQRVKENITPISLEDIAEMKKCLKAVYFNYTSEEFGKGEWAGILAQDLEKSKVGRYLVSEAESGIKFIDMKKVLSVFLATMAVA